MPVAVNVHTMALSDFTPILSQYEKCDTILYGADTLKWNDTRQHA
jgi:HD superfamily phosphohydrolase YqeK